MKKFTTLCFIIAVSINSFAQITNLLQNDFTGYTGLVSTVASGWYYSWNDTAATSRSFYTSSGNYGMSSPSYKFGRDSVTIVSPNIQALGIPDSVSFWMKGNGTMTNPFNAQNALSIYESPDSITWTLSQILDSLVVTTNGSTDSVTVRFPLQPSTAYLKFFYHKVVGNLAFDDLNITGTLTGLIIPDNSRILTTVYPNPASSFVNVESKSIKINSVSVKNILGKEVKRSSAHGNKIQMDISGLDAGVYLVFIRTEMGVNTQRLVIRR